MAIRLQAPEGVESCTVPMDAERCIVVETEADACQWERHGFTRIAFPPEGADTTRKKGGKKQDGPSEAGE